MRLPCASAISRSVSISIVVLHAHTLKGMLASLSATRAASAAAGIEEVGRSETVSELDVVLAAFDVEMTRLLPKVDSYLLES
jgi:HPt (histidine-containing phosphotransfer) domain-containing protein